MRSLKLGLAATAVICALSATAQADCIKVGAVGEAVTHDIAVIFVDARSCKRHLWAGPRGQGPGPHDLRRQAQIRRRVTPRRRRAK